MKIRIDKEYFIHIDEWNYTLKMDREGKSELIIGYYSSVKKCLLEYIKRKQIKLEGDVDLKYYISSLDFYKKELEEVVQKVNEEIIKKVQS